MIKSKNVSVKSLTIVLLATVGVLSVLVSFISGEYFFNAARHAQTLSVKKIIEVAATEVIDDANKNALELAHSIANAKSLKTVFKNKNRLDKSRLTQLLDDPFVKGFSGSASIELVKVRVYDLDLNFIAESHSGILTLEKKLPDVIYQQAYPRKGVDRVMALSSLWVSNDVLYYSVMVPVGGMRIAAYLELVINPINNLAAISSKIHIPVSLSSVSEAARLYYKPVMLPENVLPVKHVIYNNYGDPVTQLTAYDDITTLNREMSQTVYSSIIIFICLMVLVLFVSLWLFRKFMFKPLEAIQRDIDRIKQGDTGHNLSAEGFSEITLLAGAFNEMKAEVNARTRDLERLTSQDPLTGIANRRYFDESLRREYHNAFRNKEPISILLIDIDYFKRFNDANGHLAGDACLQAVTGVIANAVTRPADIVARYGGEEFAVILPSTPVAGMKVIANHIQEAMKISAIPHDDSPISDMVTLSIGGCSIVPTDHDRMTALVNEADKALYKAKRAGRNQSVFSNDSPLFVISRNDSA